MLQCDHPNSMSDLLIAVPDTPHVQAWSKLHESVSSGRPSVPALFGMPIFAYYAAHPDERASFSRAMGNLSALAAQGIGMILVRAPFVGAAAFVCGVVFTGTAPSAVLLARFVPFALAAMLLVYGLHVVIGLLAFWLRDVTPVFWIAQKLLFVLGGLMLPLTLYPDWVQRLAHLTPFPAMLGGPAGLLVAATAPDLVQLARDLAIWIAVVAIVARTLFQRAVRTLQVSGG